MIGEIIYLGIILLVLGYPPYLLIKSIYGTYLIKTGKSKAQRELAESWHEFDKGQRKYDIADRRRKEEQLVKYELFKEKELKKAENLISRNKFEEALNIYDKYGYRDLKLSTLKKQAYIREEALDYDSAILIWEELGEIEEAARIRKLKTEQGSVKVAQKVVQGDEITKTEIKDSVVNRSNIGGKSSKAEELREAKSLFEEGLIDDEEYKQMKKEILGK